MNLTNLSWLENIYTAVIILCIFLRLISIIRVAKDISARTNNTILQIISILLVTFFSPVIGLPLYHIIKPIWYKRDKMPRREACVTNTTICHNCGVLNSKDYKCCINCWKKIIIKCKECETEYPHNYHYCPKCWWPNIELI
jgi:hypothetical protein